MTGPQEVFRESGIPFILAGLNPSKSLERLAGQSSNVTLLANPPEEKMNELIRTAQVNIMVTFQPTGLKLKLLNALFNGRHCLVNPEMVAGTELGMLCETGSNARELREKVEKLMMDPFGQEQMNLRREKLMRWHSNKENCIRLLNLVSLFSGSRNT
jgi:hypothetical protein